MRLTGGARLPRPPARNRRAGLQYTSRAAQLYRKQLEKDAAKLAQADGGLSPVATPTAGSSDDALFSSFAAPKPAPKPAPPAATVTLPAAAVAPKAAPAPAAAAASDAGEEGDALGALPEGARGGCRWARWPCRLLRRERPACTHIEF